MKKIMTLCFFAFAMVMGTQTMNAQSMVETNSIASKKTQELKKAVKFNSETENLVYEAYQAYEQKMGSVKNLETNGDTVSKEDKEKIANVLAEKLKTIFSADEYKRFLAFVDQHQAKQ